MNTHGHVTPNQDGSIARCGGPAICSVCALEKSQYEAELKSQGKIGYVSNVPYEANEPVQKERKPKVDRIIEGLQILKKYGEVNVSADHDELFAVLWIADEFPEDEAGLMKNLGWLYDSRIGTWSIFV